MECSERVRKAIQCQTVDRVPAGLFGTHTDYEHGLAAYVGCATVEEMYRKLQIDVWHTGGLTYRGHADVYRGRPIDTGYALYWEHNPDPPFADLESSEQVEAYAFPTMADYDETALLQEIDSHDEFALCTGINSALFHNYLYMCGQENGLCYLKIDPDIAHAIIRRITDFWVSYLDHVLDIAGHRATFVENCNDFGSQRTMLISPEDFRTFFKPQLQRLYDTAHRHGVLYMQHSCGAVSPIIEDFIEMGADLLNPIQISASGMSLAEVAARFHGRIALYGGIDTQYLLPQGPVNDIQAAVRQALSLFGCNGGYILSGSQGLMDDIPYMHAAAMLDPALRKE